MAYQAWNNILDNNRMAQMCNTALQNHMRYEFADVSTSLIGIR
jgi:hypothetical protein